MENREVRGIKLSIFGIIINLVLFVIKLFAGIISNSSAIIGESLNNLLDSIAFIISIIGFKIAKKPKNHYYPFGYGRIEYISGFIISILTVLVGIELLKFSFGKILVKETIVYSKIVFVVLLISIIFKMIIGIYSYSIYKKIKSLTIKALAEDSFSDMLISCITLISYILSYNFGWKLDGYMGIIVGLVIVYSGIKTMMEISKPLIGNRDDIELTKDIGNIIMTSDRIESVEDIMVHNYGNEKWYCSACAVITKDMAIGDMRDDINAIRKKLKLEYNNMDIEIGFKIKELLG